jgi:hypothetical protein
VLDTQYFKKSKQNFDLDEKKQEEGKTKEEGDSPNTEVIIRIY